MNKIKTRKLFIGIGAGVALVLITFAILLTALIWYFITGGPAKRSNNIEDYQEIFDLYLYSGLLVFPEEIPENVVETEFFYNYRDALFDPTYQIFLRCVYDEETYEREKERLENTKRVYGKREAWPLRDEEGKYPYPAYVSIENYGYGYEYALLSGENEITYISTLFVEEYQVRFDRKYLPKDFMTNKGRKFGSGYSIYEVDRNGMGISLEYDRIEVVIVEEKYFREVEEGCFVVTTEYYAGREEEERVTGIYFVYGDNPQDESAKRIEYQKGKGMEYRDFVLREDGKSVTLICANGEGRKEYVLEVPEEDVVE